MKRIKSIVVLFAFALLSIGVEAQNIKPSEQLYMQLSVGGNSLAGLPKTQIRPIVSYSVGDVAYIYNNLFFDVSAELNYKAAAFDAMLNVPNGTYENTITLSTIGLNLPVTIGKSFIINETNQQVDFKGGLYLSVGLFSWIIGAKKHPLIGYNGDFPSYVSGYSLGKDYRTYTSRFNLGLALTSRYWVLPQMFVLVDAKLDFFNNVLSEDFRMPDNNGYNKSPNTFGSRNFNISLGVGYAF